MAKPIRPQTQGSADGMCGIYSILNFLHYKKLDKLIKDNAGNNGFYWVLRAAEKRLLLDSEHLSGGFYATELLAIFNDVALYHSLPYRAFMLSDFCKWTDAVSLFLAVEQAEAEGGALIVEVYGGTHWLLATRKAQKGIEVYDSAHSVPQTVIERDKISSFSQDGLAILPKTSSLVSF